LELLVVIYHPGTSVRPVKELMAEVAGEYDRAMGTVSDRHTAQTHHTAVLHLKWPAADLGWQHWVEDEEGVLATVGMPLLSWSPDSGASGGKSGMLTPGRLAKLIRGGANGAAGELGFCGGYFAGAHISHDGQVRLITNYMGEVPMYRAQGDRGLVVWSNKATAAANLAGLELKLDQRAAREFLLLSHPLENRTLLEGVCVEPAATCVMIDAGGMHRKLYVDLPVAYFEHRLPKKDAAARVIAGMEPLIETLKQHKDESGDGSGGARLHLSGGMDSRAVGAICAHYGYRPKALTHNTPNDEVASAKPLAKCLGMRYRQVESWLTSAPDFFELVGPSLWQSDGLMSLKYLCGHYDLELARDENYMPIEGYGGEHGRGYFYGSGEARQNLGQGRFDKLYEKLLGNRGELMPSPGAATRVRETIKALLDESREFGLDPYQTATWFYVSQRTRRWAASRRNAGWNWVIDPLQQPCWTYYAWSASPDDQCDQGLIRSVIDQAKPGTMNVPTSNQLAYQARRRRVASNRLMRSWLKMYDRMKKTKPPSIQTQMLQVVRPELVSYISAAQDLLPQFITSEDADHWLDRKPWNYDQTELFWHASTLVMWCRQFQAQPPAIGCASVEQ